MNSVFFDASALIKRYAREAGAAVVDEIFLLAPASRLACSHLGVLEVFSILIRQHNDRRLSRSIFEQAIAECKSEVSNNPDFTKTSVNDALLTAAVDLLSKHNLNASDTIILLSAINLQLSLHQKGDDLILCVADKRLARAATVEGITVFNPETDTIPRLHQLL